MASMKKANSKSIPEQSPRSFPIVASSSPAQSCSSISSPPSKKTPRRFLEPITPNASAKSVASPFGAIAQSQKLLYPAIPISTVSPRRTKVSSKNISATGFPPISASATGEWPWVTPDQAKPRSPLGSANPSNITSPEPSTSPASPTSIMW